VAVTFSLSGRPIRHYVRVSQRRREKDAPIEHTLTLPSRACDQRPARRSSASSISERRGLGIIVSRLQMCAHRVRNLEKITNILLYFDDCISAVLFTIWHQNCLEYSGARTLIACIVPTPWPSHSCKFVAKICPSLQELVYAIGSPCVYG
jgi:hypothetical protein